MLYKNDEPFKLTDKHIKDLKKVVGDKFPVVFKMNKGLFVPHPNRENLNRIERPGGVIIPFEERVDDKGEGSIKWNYCELPPKRKGDDVQYYTDGRAALFVTGTKFNVTSQKIDLLWYLVNVSKCIKVPGASPYSETPLFVMENTHLEAKERNQYREQKAAVEGAIFGHQKLSEAEILRLAKAFRISNADARTDDELRDLLITAVEARQQDRLLKDGYTVFLDMAGNSNRIEGLVLIQRAKDMKRISYADKSAMWVTLDDNGKKTGELCRLISGKTQEESLEYHVTTNEETMKRLREAVPEEEPAETES